MNLHRHAARIAVLISATALAIVTCAVAASAATSIDPGWWLDHHGSAPASCCWWRWWEPAHARLVKAPQRHAQPAAATPPAASPLPTGNGNLTLLGINDEATGAVGTAWADAVLKAMDAPPTSANVQTMLGWFANEGTPHDLNNPLNSNVPYGGSTVSTANGNPASDRIQAYPTPEDGVMGIAEQFTTAAGGDASYPAITAALRAGTGLEGSAATSEIASELSIYSGGGYDSILSSGNSGSVIAVQKGQ